MGIEELVLRPVEVAELLRVGRVGLLDGHLAWNFSISISMVSLMPTGLRKRGPKPAQRPVEPNSSLAKFCRRMYSESDQRLLVVRRPRPGS